MRKVKFMHLPSRALTAQLLCMVDCQECHAAANEQRQNKYFKSNLDKKVVAFFKSLEIRIMHNSLYRLLI